MLYFISVTAVSCNGNHSVHSRFLVFVHSFDNIFDCRTVAFSRMLEVVIFVLVIIVLFVFVIVLFIEFVIVLFVIVVHLVFLLCIVYKVSVAVIIVNNALIVGFIAVRQYREVDSSSLISSSQYKRHFTNSTVQDVASSFFKLISVDR